MSIEEVFYNDYALHIEDDIIHISQTVSGRKGYFCLSCKRKMQSVITQKENRLSYFRHDAEAIKNQPKCTYSSETYRHKLAKDILQILKKIKVTSVYKYPPSGFEGQQQLLELSKFIEASYVCNEITFY